MPTRGNVYRWRAQAACWFGALFGSFGCGLIVDTSLPTTCLSEAECPSGGTCVGGMCRLAILGPETACNSNTECRAAGSQYCVNGQCIQDPANADCSVWPENALDRESNKLLLGFIGDTRVPGQDVVPNPDKYGTPLLEGVQLALQEIAQSDSRGLPGINGGPPRNLALIECKEDDGTGPDYPRRMAQYLVEQAKVPAIIGASYSGNTLYVWEQYIKTLEPQRSTLLISPSSTSPFITDETEAVPGRDPENRLWRTAPSDTIQAELLTQLAITVRDHLAPSRSAKPTLRIVIKDDAAGNGLIGQLEGSLANEFDSIVSNFYDDPSTSTDQWRTQANLVMGADIILALGTTEFVEFILPEIEGNWATLAPQAPRPWYVLPEGDRALPLPRFAQSSTFALNERVIGAAPGARSSENYDGFRRSFNARFEGREPGNLAEFGYDAAYLLVYAIARANQQYPSALQLSAALDQLTCLNGQRLAPPRGVETLSEQFVRATNDGCVNFAGASGELDFDENGEAPSDIALWCLRPNMDGSFTYDPILDQYYDAAGKTVAGPPLDLASASWCPPPPAP